MTKLFDLFPLFCALQHATLGTATYLRHRAEKLVANESNIYDYVVTGSGPGGGTIAVNLARAGHSILLVEAGGDESDDITTQIVSLGSLILSSSVSWSFFVKHSDDIERAKRYNLMVWKLHSGELWVGRNPASEGHFNAVRPGVFYPRGAILGGSAIINAAATFLPSDSDWDFFDKDVGDGVWSGRDMRRVFGKIEHNNYLEAGTPGHGFDGWLQTNVADRSLYSVRSPKIKGIQAALRLLGKDPSRVVDYLISDANYLDKRRDETQMLFALLFHRAKTWKRFSPRDRILATHKETHENGTLKFPLHLQLHSLTTRVLFSDHKEDEKPCDVHAEREGVGAGVGGCGRAVDRRGDGEVMRASASTGHAGVSCFLLLFRSAWQRRRRT